MQLQGEDRPSYVLISRIVMESCRKFDVVGIFVVLILQLNQQLMAVEMFQGIMIFESISRSMNPCNHLHALPEPCRAGLLPL